MSECSPSTTENTTSCGTHVIDIQCYLILNSRFQKVLIAVLCIGAGAFCILENILVLCMIWTSARLRRKASYLFLSSLALADLFASLIFSYSFVDFHVFHEAGSPTAFLFKLGVVTTSFTGSLGSLLILAFDRYICIHKPLAYKSLVTRKRAVLVLFGMWISTIFISYLPLMGWNCCSLLSVCSELFPLVDNRYLAIWITLVGILLSSIICFYAHILWKAHSHANDMEKYNKQAAKGQGHMRIDITLAKTLALVLIILIVCWSPALIIMIHSLLYSLSRSIKTIFAFCSTLCLVNSMVNPIIYALRSKELRYKLIKGLKKCKTVMKLSKSEPEVEGAHKNSGFDTGGDDTVCDTEMSN
ncbi:cannabinoid receptor 2 [Bombina bombina]|uniref:cannabinoid receptor 2 n=1 Tax=Bombina bombina TaxID=8345 RepID=UPI00235AFCF7|nr:cannabinoid receptor 2 [Bombina bombina]